MALEELLVTGGARPAGGLGLGPGCDRGPVFRITLDR